MDTESKQSDQEKELENLQKQIEKKDYMGDGVYVRFDGFHVIMTTEDGISAQNTICLEDTVVESFERYLARIRLLLNKYKEIKEGEQK